MVFESISSDDLTNNAEASPLASCSSQIQIKSENNSLLLILPQEAETNSVLPWSEIWQELKHLLQTKEQSWQAQTPVCLVAGDRLLDTRQLQTITETLTEAQLQLIAVRTNRRQTAVAAATMGYSVEQNSEIASLNPEPPSSAKLLAEPLYIQQTVRSGVEIRHPGTIIICGDLNPGGIAIAEGDIFVWGRLRGVAHAGAQGKRKSLIMALQMEFTQLRIADTKARSPQRLPQIFQPEVAFVSSGGISLARANDFTKTHLFSTSEDSWLRTNS